VQASGGVHHQRDDSAIDRADAAAPPEPSTSL